MRLKRNRLKLYNHRPAISKKDNEGNSYIEYGLANSFMAIMWPAGGKVQAEMYGQRLPAICNLKIDGDYETVTDGRKLTYKLHNGPCITANDGICLHVPGECEPDYRVVAIYPYQFLTLEVEKL